MAKVRWNQAEVDKVAAGRYSLGGGLLLVKSDSGKTKYFFRFMLKGRSREMALAADKFSEAQNLAVEAKRVVKRGIDPLEARKVEAANAEGSQTKGKTFKDYSLLYIEANKPQWKSATHLQQWENTLQNYAYPLIGHMDLADIKLANILEVLTQRLADGSGTLWNMRRETAVRLRGRVETILEVYGPDDAPNPAKWTRKLEGQLGGGKQVTTNQAALTPAELGDFVAKLKGYSSVSALALRFVLLTAVRTMEALDMSWEEVDLKAKVWTIPGSRMKGPLGETPAHRVPLSDPALDVLEQMKTRGTTGKVFGLGQNALLQFIRPWGFRTTIHGFRSTFRQWAAQQGAKYSEKACEMCLAHRERNKVVAAYDREDRLDERRLIMADWAAFTGL